MTGPSPWRLPSPRGGLTSVTVSGSTIELVGSIIELPVPNLELYRTGKKGQGRMNITLVAAVVLLGAWLVLVFHGNTESGAVHMLYAAGIVLLARRVLVGAPRFRSWPRVAGPATGPPCRAAGSACC